MQYKLRWSVWPTLLSSFVALFWAQLAQGYITAPVATLGQLSNSTYITLVRVEKVSKEKGIIIYRKVHDIKGRYPKDVIKHVFDLKNTPQHKGPGDVPIRPDEQDWQYAIQWAATGKTAVLFTLKYDPYGDFGHTYIDGCWYATMCPGRDWEFWYSIYSDPALLSRWHCGTPTQLVSAVEVILAGKEAVVPVLAGSTKADLRMGRATIQGLKVGPRIQDYKPKRDLVTGLLDKALVPSLVKLLQDSNRDNRARAVRELRLLGAKANGAVAALLGVLQDKDDEVRTAALTALEELGEAKEAVPAFTEALKNCDPLVRRSATRGLGKLGLQAKAAVPELTALLPTTEGMDRLEIAEVLVRIDPENKAVVFSVAELVENQKSGKEIRLRAAALLGQFGAAAVPVLLKTLQDPDKDIRVTTAELLAQVGPAAKEAIPVLGKTVADDPSGTVRMRAADALARMGPEAKTALPALRAALRDPSMAQRQEVLAKITEVYNQLK